MNEQLKGCSDSLEEKFAQSLVSAQRRISQIRDLHCPAMAILGSIKIALNLSDCDNADLAIASLESLLEVRGKALLNFLETYLDEDEINAIWIELTAKTEDARLALILKMFYRKEIGNSFT